MIIWLAGILCSVALACPDAFEDRLEPLVQQGTLETYQCVVAHEDAERQLVSVLELQPDHSPERVKRALVFVLLNTLHRPWNPKNVARLSASDRRLLADGVKAMRGRKSPAKEHHQIFEQWSWYKPVPSYTDNQLTSMDKINIAMADNPSEFMPKEPAVPLNSAREVGCGCVSSSVTSGSMGFIILFIFLSRTFVRRT